MHELSFLLRRQQTQNQDFLYKAEIQGSRGYIERLSLIKGKLKVCPEDHRCHLQYHSAHLNSVTLTDACVSPPLPPPTLMC